MIRQTGIAAILAAALVAAPAGAHEFLVKPAVMAAGPDEAIDFEILSTHVFFAPEEMEAATSVAVAFVDAEGSVPVAIAEDEAAAVLRGSVAGTGAPAWLAAHRLGQVWSKTAEGWVQGGRDVAPDAEFTNRYEKFAKVLVSAEPGAPIATRPIGQLLEIVPLGDPAALAAGEEIDVQVLFDGAPVEASLTATFDGFSTRPGTYAYMTETAEDARRGPVASIKTWSPGLWVVRAEHRTDNTPGIDEHVIRSVMIFEVE